MKTLKTLLAVSASSLLAMSANAAISYGNSADAQPYVGAKIGQVDAKSKSTVKIPLMVFMQVITLTKILA